MGATITNAKSSVPKSNFFILLPPLRYRAGTPKKVTLLLDCFIKATIINLLRIDFLVNLQNSLDCNASEGTTKIGLGALK
jgi:hypothetical protein